MKEKLKEIIERKYWNIVFFTGVLCLYFINFWIITKSGYRCDDCYNSNILGVCQITGESLYDLVVSSIKEWMNMGRFFPFSAYAFYVFGIFSTRFSYKMFLVVMTLLNSLVFGHFIEKLTGSKKLNYIFILLFPILIPLQCEYNSALYAYHGLAHMVLLWMTLSWLMLLKYMETKKIRYNILNALFLFIALGTYEVAFVLILIHIIIVWASQKNIIKSLKILLLDFAVYITTIGINVFLHFQASSSYDGTSFGLQPDLVFYGFKKQLMSAVPLVRSYVTYGETYGLRDFLWMVRTQIHFSDIVVLCLVFLGIFLVIFKLKKEEIKKENYKWFYLTGIILWGLPAILMGLSGKYQIETQMGMGHLPSYIQNFGFTLICAIFLYYIYTKIQKHKIMKIIYLIIMFCIVAFILFVNQFMARNTVKGENMNYLYPRDNVEAAIHAGILDEVSQGKTLFVSTDYVMDSLGPSIFYTHVSKKVVNALPVLDNKNLPVTGDDYTIFSYADDSAGFVAVGKYKELILDEEKTEIQDLGAQNILLYIGGAYKYAENIAIDKCIDNEYKTITIKIKELLDFKETKDGKLYKIPSDDIFNIRSIRIY